MKKKSEMKAGEIQRYYKAKTDTRENLVASISKLERRNRRLSAEPGEAAENDLKIGVLRADKAEVDAHVAAFEAGRHGVNPPSSEQLETLKTLVTRVEQLTVERRILEEVVALTNKALGTFKEIHPGQTA